MDSVNLLGPELILLAVAGLGLLIDVAYPVGALSPRRKLLLTGGLAVAGAGGSMAWAGALIATDTLGDAFSATITVDKFSLFFNFLFASTAAVVILASVDLLRRSRYAAEYCALILASAAGLMLMAAAQDLIVIFVALELTSISQYILVGLLKDRRSSEAGIKYLLLGAISSAVILYGDRKSVV